MRKYSEKFYYQKSIFLMLYPLRTVSYKLSSCKILEAFCCGLFLKTTQPIRKLISNILEHLWKPDGMRSGDLGENSKAPLQPIYLYGNTYWLTGSIKCGGTSFFLNHNETCGIFGLTW